jgi:hypothetical protein
MLPDFPVISKWARLIRTVTTRRMVKKLGKYFWEAQETLATAGIGTK